MVPRSKKLDAIYNFTVMVGQSPMFAYLMGYLAGQVDRVNFVDDLTGADIAVKISIRRTAVWPHEPFKAFVRGVAMPNPFTLVRSVNQENTPICVSLDFDHAEETPWYQEVVLPNVSYVTNAIEAAREESEALRQEMDRTLDIYRECKNMLKDSSPERQKELGFYMKLAEQQLKSLSQQLEELNKKMRQLAES
ncbi:MAG: hypothetical protein IMF26_10480 [Candidatus Fermentithermobacillus carboniphilus]|uniref:Uncharacterized protein n=1 Tax=Candidatus Fermentithermobacillus carboniphilus TaxID=3085328 RepID=A0AAT9LBA5_9FIRM|nr:MAG: hypothetical protein IMF26_10480 [Candidatus Fermentithermobacillus carboniphilus]